MQQFKTLTRGRSMALYEAIGNPIHTIVILKKHKKKYLQKYIICKRVS